jgi:nitroimidazol reductase NimA-like FMN-containing flavoprotein (pyridoxamine 5'-phosphate oxidase superfamily)
MIKKQRSASRKGMGEENQDRPTDHALKERIRNLVKSQSFCVLCTQGEGQPYGSLIAYGFTGNLKHFFFTTPKPTRKYKQLKECDRVSLVIDSRCRHPEETIGVEAVTITGRARQVDPEKGHRADLEMLKKRHPYMAHFLDSASTALFEIEAVRYLYVTRFQEVYQWIP